MKIGFFAEGCYPYVVGGVSSWTHQLMRHFSGYTFVLHTIVATPEDCGRFRYELPPNVTSVLECSLVGAQANLSRRYKLTQQEMQALRALVLGEEADWDDIFRVFDSQRVNISDFLMSYDFYGLVLELYERSYRQTVFTDFLWTIRSMYAPLFRVLSSDVEDADVFHSASTGYAGILAVKAARKYGRPLIITEHGIYTREREEEIIKADWTQGVYKDMWIAFFYSLSHCAYRYADRVVSLFEGARSLQTEIGCPQTKTQVIPNGIQPDLYAQLPQKAPEDPCTYVGSVLRIAPIKDVKTMLTAFSFARKKLPMLRLWLLGPTDEDEDYFQECLEISRALGIEEDVRFWGRVNVPDYLGKLDIFLLTSISEGQPLSMLEAMAASVPLIATRVGNCEGLIQGERDEYGPCGIPVAVMNTSAVAKAIEQLASDPSLRLLMGLAGKRRVLAEYTAHQFLNQYQALYEEMAQRG